MASSKREKELARQRAERQAARRNAATQRRKQRNAIIAAIAAVALVAVAGIGTALALRDDSPADTLGAEGTPTAAPSAAASPKASAKASPATQAGAGTCTYEKTEEKPARAVELPPTTGVETESVFTVTIATNRGDIVFDMDSAKAPCTANNIRSLAHFAYFDDTPCHRLTTEGIDVLQCGDPTGTGTGGPGYQFAEENLDGARYPRGTVAMARGVEGGTNGSQFFLVYQDSELPPNYTPFGVITEGLDVLEEIAAAGSDNSNGNGDGKPKLPVVIKTLRAAVRA